MSALCRLNFLLSDLRVNGGDFRQLVSRLRHCWRDPANPVAQRGYHRLLRYSIATPQFDQPPSRARGHDLIISASIISRRVGVNAYRSRGETALGLPGALDAALGC